MSALTVQQIDLLMIAAWSLDAAIPAYTIVTDAIGPVSYRAMVEARRLVNSEREFVSANRGK